MDTPAVLVGLGWVGLGWVGLGWWLCFTGPLDLAWRVVGCSGSARAGLLAHFPSATPPCSHRQCLELLLAAFGDGKTASLTCCSHRCGCHMRVLAGDEDWAEPPLSLHPPGPGSGLPAASCAARLAPRLCRSCWGVSSAWQPSSFSLRAQARYPCWEAGQQWRGPGRCRRCRRGCRCQSPALAQGLGSDLPDLYFGFWSTFIFADIDIII